MADSKQYEVIIIGGSYAGLSAAMSLGRSLRKVLVIDSGLPCNRYTPHSHNFITHDGKTPAEISMLARQQIESYNTVRLHNGLAVKGRKTKAGFEIETEAKEVFTAKKLIFATGVKDIMPDIEGFEACWGTSVIHCPYCHGYEVKGLETGLLLNGDMAMHLAPLVRNLTDKLTVFTNGKASFSTEQTEKLHKHGIRIIENEVDRFEHQNAYIEQIVFKDGSSAPVKALYARPAFVQHSGIPESLGCELTEHGYLAIDGFQKTNIEGVYACGDNVIMMRSVANAVASGNFTGAMVNKDLADALFNA